MGENILLTLEYDGSAYHGWQRQKNSVSVQQTLEQALSAIYRQPVAIIGAGRTDTGVHAYGQRANFISPHPIPLAKLAKIINAKLPPDIRVRQAEIVAADFHARYSAKGKLYRYLIEQGGPASAFTGSYSWNVGGPLDVEAMTAAAQYLLGQHDFRYFTVSGVSAVNFVRQIRRLDISCPVPGPDLFPWQRLNAPLVLAAEADGFLYKMVRIITGRLAAVGRGALKPEQIRDFLDGSLDLNIPPAPPQGLMLMAVYY